MRLEGDVEMQYRGKRGQAAGGIIGLMIAVIMLLAVAYPVINETVSNLALTGTEATIAGVITLMLLVAGLVLVTNIMR